MPAGFADEKRAPEETELDEGLGKAVQRTHGEEGYLLLALVVAMFLLALFLTIAAPTVARSLERDKEVESEHRAQQYVRAIHNYYMKFNTYPASLDALLNSNNQHFLRQQYKDPLTGGDYRLIHFGEAKTTVKGFFGEPLDGLQQGSLGALSGSASGIGTGVGGAGTTAASGSPAASSSGSGSGFGSGFTLANSGFSSGQNSTGTGTTGSTGTGTTGSGTTGSGSTLGGINATQFQGSKGMIVGVGSTATGHGLVEWNGSANIEDWEFLYDHRTWLLKQRVSIFGGSVGQGGNGSGFGSSFSNSGSAFGSGSSTSGSSSGTPLSAGFGNSTPALGLNGVNSSPSSSSGNNSSPQP